MLHAPYHVRAGAPAPAGLPGVEWPLMRSPAVSQLGCGRASSCCGGGGGAQASHKKGSRKSRHGHKEPLYVPLDDDNDAADLAARLTHQAQVPR